MLSGMSVGCAELSAFCGGVLCFLWAVVGRTLKLHLLLRALLLSCYGKVLLIPAVIWEHDYSPLCLGLIKLFVLTSNSQAIRGRMNKIIIFSSVIQQFSETCVETESVPFLYSNNPRTHCSK